MNKPLEFTWRSFGIFAFLLWSLGAIAGVLIVQKVNLDNQDYLPACQEDEYLYPKDDYKGPGANKPSDYGCFNFDDQMAIGSVMTCQLDNSGKEVICIDNTTGEVIDNG